MALSAHYATASPALASRIRCAASYYGTPGARATAHGAKRGCAGAVSAMALALAPLVEPGSILVPVPGHGGLATYTRDLADEVACLVRAAVADILRGISRPPLYELKLRRAPIDPQLLGLRLAAPPPPAQTILLLDNVVATGCTARAALRLLPSASVLAYALDETAAPWRSPRGDPGLRSC